ncbi:uncharacterized protein LOC119688006 [Teleopsis dalmanni]|uniref:uncharacterized protein LOC119688006 n=1 Tax=Teleopsis dalmanni TaxID=139649 RepID=UPI000D32A1F8|nr:uncharacterized protein LOC119688006 [Teleopsis dalmanni]
MRQQLGILLTTLIIFGLMELTPADVDLRGTLQSLVYSYNQLDNKLERHEHRDRAASDILKRGIQTLLKGQKDLEPINGIFSRLDERVSQIETLLITQEEKYNAQTQKLSEALEHMFKWMRENDECYKRPPVPLNAVQPTSPTLEEKYNAQTQKLNEALEHMFKWMRENSECYKRPPVVPVVPTNTKLSDDFIKKQEAINSEMLAQIKKLTDNVERLLDNSKNMMEHTEVAFRSVPSTAEMLTKIEDKLISYSVAPVTPIIEPIDNKEFENKVIEKLSDLATGIADLQTLPTPQEALTQADKDFIHGLNNETLNALEHIKVNTLSASDEALAKTTSRIKETEEHLENNMNKVFDATTQSSSLLEKFYNEINGSCSKLNDGLEIFQKFNNILMTTSEYVLDTQRKVDFGTVQIVQKLSNILDKQREEMVVFMTERFDNVDESIVSNHFEAFQNLSALVESEISHVWRQISLMHTEITDSKDLLGLMNGRNEIYLNSTFISMDAMNNKVAEIRARMLDMDSNLNFLLGKLSIMSQEFGNIKNGLAESLEELRNSFHTMQEKMPPHGPGPHDIAKNEYETEVNLLQKRQTAE